MIDLRLELFDGERFFVRSLIILIVALRFIFLGTIYLISALDGRLRYPNFTVNGAYAIDPERAIAAFILPLSAMAGFTVTTLRLRRIRKLLHAPSHWAIWWFMVVHVFMGTFGLFGLGAISPATDIALAYVVGGFWYAGNIGLITATTVLNQKVDLIQPRWLINYRFIVNGVILGAALVVAITIGWQPAPSSIGEIIQSSSTVLYTLTFAHESDFLMRSRCPFALPASVPPVPYGPEHQQVILKEVDYLERCRRQNMNTQRTLVRLLIFFIILMMLAMLLTVYLVSALQGFLIYPNLYISNAFVKDPTRAVAEFMLPVIAFFFILVSAARLNRFSPYVYRKWDVVLFWTIIVLLAFFLIGTVGVAAVSLTTLRSLHLVAVFFLFIAAVLLVLSFTVLDERIDIDRPDSVRDYRRVMAFVIVFTGLALAIATGLSNIAGSVLEIVLILEFLMYLASWWHESDFPIKSRSLPEYLPPLQAAPPSVPPI